MAFKDQAAKRLNSKEMVKIYHEKSGPGRYTMIYTPHAGMDMARLKKQLAVAKK